MRLTSTVLLGVVIIAILSFLVRETVDADTWWQVAIGRDILQNFSVPKTDHFSAAGWGRSYHDSHWLFQVIVAFADRLYGMKAVTMVMVGLWSATLAICYRAMRLHLTTDVAAILIFIVAMACSDRFTPRPDLITCLMTVLFYLRLQQGKYRNTWDIAVMVLLQIVWSNSHGLFVLGPFLASCYLAMAMFDRFRGGGNGLELKSCAKLFLLLLLATLVTPFGFGGWRYALLLMTEAGPSATGIFPTLVELVPTFSSKSFSNPDFWFFVAELLLLAVVTVIVLLKKNGGVTPRLLIVAAMAITATTGRRNIPLFALTAAPLIAENLSVLMPRLSFAPAVRTGIGVLLLGAVWFPLSGSYYRMINYPLRFGIGESPSLFSSRLPDYLKKTGYSGQIYNSNYMGGLCSYHGIRPLVDGRWEVYGNTLLQGIFSAPTDPAAFDRLVATYDIKGIVMQHESPEGIALVPKLVKDPRWRLAWYDFTLSFWTPSAGVQLPPPSLPAKEPERIEDYLELATFYHLIGAYDKALPLLQHALVSGGDKEKALVKLGSVLIKLGRFAEAESAYRTLLKHDGKNADALNELAFFAVQRGDVKGAELLLRRALDIKPDDPNIRANYERVVGPLPAR
jgi:hypothetical protein